MNHATWRLQFFIVIKRGKLDLLTQKKKLKYCMCWYIPAVGADREQALYTQRSMKIQQALAALPQVRPQLENTWKNYIPLPGLGFPGGRRGRGSCSEMCLVVRCLCDAAFPGLRWSCSPDGSFPRVPSVRSAGGLLCRQPFRRGFHPRLCWGSTQSKSSKTYNHGGG